MINRLSRPIPRERGMGNLGSQAYYLEEDFRNDVVPHLHSGHAYRLKGERHSPSSCV